LRTLQLVIVVTFLGLAIGLLPAVRSQANYSVTISVQGLPSDYSTPLYLDAGFIALLSGGQSTVITLNDQVAGSMHTAAVNAYEPSAYGNNGIRYHSSDSTWSFSGPGKHVFTYREQFLVTVQSHSGSVEGGGWYYLASPVHVIFKPTGQGYVFQGWTVVGASCSGGASSNPCTFNMPSNPVTITANLVASAITSTVTAISSATHSTLSQETSTTVYSTTTLSNTSKGTPIVSLTQTPTSVAAESSIVELITTPIGEFVTALIIIIAVAAITIRRTLHHRGRTPPSENTASKTRP